MIVKGKSRAEPGALAAHLSNAEKNERVEFLGSRGTVASDLRGALAEMDAYALGTKCQKSLYHAAISPEPPHRLTPQQRMEAVDLLEAKLGLQSHSRVIVMHEKLGREHIHVVWARVDTNTMKAAHDGHNFRKHEEAARELERRFGHERVQGAHHERDGAARPDRTPSRAELRQEERTGIKGKDVKAEISEAFRSSDGPEAFRAALAERNYKLAIGDRRDFVVIDRAGGIHSLARRIDAMKADDLRAFMAPLDRNQLPSAVEAQLAARKLYQRELELRGETILEKKYGRGGDYVSQSRTALRDHQARQKQLDRTEGSGVWDRIEAGERERELLSRPSSEETRDTDKPSLAMRDIEMTEAMQARLDQLLGGSDGPPRDNSRQPQAPGGGRTRSR